MKTIHINEFLFDKASYRIIAHDGTSIKLIVNYDKNSFVIIGGTKGSSVIRELQRIAKDLLIRKHKKNFAERVLS